MTLADMAREIERRRPGTLPHPIHLAKHEVRYVWARTLESDGSVSSSTVLLTDAVASAILRDAMVMTTDARRMRVVGTYAEFFGWKCNGREYMDSDHGNDPTRSLFAAFCAAVPEAKP